MLDRLGPSVGGWPKGAIEPALTLLQASIQAQDAFIRATRGEVELYADSCLDFSAF
ncbi:MAG: hypothetical protein ACYDD1_07670 [Caulobacteraceae bacterium]